MARVNFALFLLLAAHIASTSAVYYECTNENYKNCIQNIGDLDKETDNDVICEPLKGMTTCLKSVHSSCGNMGEYADTKNEIESKLAEIEGRLGGCPKDDSMGASITAFGAAAFNNHAQETTTKRAVECTYEGFTKCTAGFSGMPGLTDYTEMCRIWWQAQGCLRDLSNCESGPVKNATEQTITSMKSSMSFCDGMTTREPWAEPNGETTRDPWAEPHGDTTRDPWAEPNGSGCTEKGMNECVYRLHRAADYMEQCRIVHDAEKCLRRLMGMCYDHDYMNHMEQKFMPQVKQIMDNCMYGNMGGLTGDNQGGWYGSAAVSTHVQSSTFVALLTALVVKMIASRF